MAKKNNKSGIDFNAIREKVAQLSGEKRRSKSSAFWRPDVGEYTVRIVPFRNNDGQPFKERWFYYNIGNNPGLLTLRQYGEPDPIQELIDKLRSEGSPEGYEMAKKLYPKMRAFAAVVVRGEEDKGVRLWSFGKMVYQSLLNIMLDPDYGDITDPLEGHDLKIKVTQPQGRTWKMTDVMPRPKPSQLSDDADMINTWIDSTPNLDEIYTKRSYDELEKIINDWVNGGGQTEDFGTSHFEGTKNTTEARNVTSNETNDPSSKKAFKDLDDVFAELEG